MLGSVAGPARSRGRGEVRRIRKLLVPLLARVFWHGYDSKQLKQKKKKLVIKRKIKKREKQTLFK
jgi:hypothetical protein